VEEREFPGRPFSVRATIFLASPELVKPRGTKFISRRVAFAP
jgi:hypothetical protein